MYIQVLFKEKQANIKENDKKTMIMVWKMRIKGDQAEE